MTLRNLLKSYGLEDDKIDEIMKIHGQAVQAEISKTDEEKKKNEEISATLNDTKKELDKLKRTNTDNKALQDSLTRAQETITGLEGKLAAQAKTSAILDAIRKDSKALDAELVYKLLDVDSIEYKDGKITGLADQLKELENGETSGLLFSKGDNTYRPVKGSDFTAESTPAKSAGQQAAESQNAQTTDLSNFFGTINY